MVCEKKVFRASTFISISSFTILFASSSIADFFKAEPHAASLFRIVLASTENEDEKPTDQDKVGLPNQVLTLGPVSIVD